MQVLRAAEKVTNNIGRGVSGYGKPIQQRVHLIVRDFMVLAVDYNWTAYRAQCQPQYCDINQRKTPFNIASEFLSTIGGLYTVVLGTATLLWAAMTFLGLFGKHASSFYVWHPVDTS